MDVTREADIGISQYIDKNLGKSIRDPLYDYIPLSQAEIAIVDSPWMQRLREIKQMGTTNRTYISANNTRFEHSLGVCHLAGKMLDSLDNPSKKGLLDQIVENVDETIYERILADFPQDDDKKNILKQSVRLVALLHDVGHGPFSHTSEQFLKVSPTYKKFRKILKPHEICSLEIMLKYIPKGIELILDNEKIDSKHASKGKITKITALKMAKKFLEEKDLIKSLFIPSYKNRDSLQPLNMIINSQLDADKLDYLRRDAYATGSEFGIALDVQRMIGGLSVRENCLCIEKKALSAAESLVDSRYKAYRYIHTHHVKLQMDEILRRAIYHGLQGGVFRINVGGNEIRNPFGAKYFGKALYKDGILCFEYGTIDDHFLIQRIREHDSTNQAVSNAKYYLERLEKRILFKSPWKVSDTFILIEEKIKKDVSIPIIKKHNLQLMEELLAINGDHISQETISRLENEIKENSTLCNLHKLISKFEKDKIPPEPLEEEIVKWIKKNSSINNISPRDVMIAHLRFDPYPAPVGREKRERIMLLHNGERKDLIYFSPEVRGLIVYWFVEKQYHGIYLYFSEPLYEKMGKDFIFENLEKLVNHLKKSKIILEKGI
ncbi:MAG: HD domain-containing protein [Theionarchaea archaeon]|nr:HD domain-containing protein [Theionarchaea archaeon]